MVVQQKTCELCLNVSIKYLGTFIDQHLSWKSHILHLAKKIKISIGVMSKIQYIVNVKILTQLYYSLIYPFLTLVAYQCGANISICFKLNHNITEKGSENYNLLQLRCNVYMTKII